MTDLTVGICANAIEKSILRLDAGDCCIASAFVSYLGPFNKEFRDLLIKRDFFSDCKDNDVPVTQNMNLTAFLVDDSTVGEWNLQVWQRSADSFIMYWDYLSACCLRQEMKPRDYAGPANR